MGRSRASKDQMAENGTVSKNRYEHRYANGERVGGREDDFRNALNYETHAEGDSVGNHWIQNAHVKKGLLHKSLGIPQGQKIPQSRLEKAEHSKNPHMRKMAQFAENVRGN